MQTLWERWTKGPEFTYYNPFKSKVGGTFTLDVLGYRDLIFSIKEINEYQRNVNNKEFVFTDYIGLAQQLGKDDVLIRMRCVPNSSFCDILVLEPYDEMKFNEELDEVLRNACEFCITDNVSGNEDKYWRIDDNIDSFIADVTLVSEKGISREKVEYWDFSRITEDEALQKFTQFLFVECNMDSKIQTMWRGIEIDPQSVNVI